MSSKLVSTFELSRNVAKLIESKYEPGTHQQGFMNKVVSKVMATYSKYISHTLKNNNEKYIVLEIPVIGTFVSIKNEGEDAQYRGDHYEFIPSVIMQQECMVMKSMPELQDHLTMKKDLKITKIAEVANIGVDQATSILSTIVQQIGFFNKQGKQVALDFQLPNNNFLIVSQGSVEFQNKNDIAGYLEQSPSSRKTTTSSVQKFNEIKAQGNELFKSPDAKSVFSKRTLSIVGSDVLASNTTPRGAKKNRYSNKRGSEQKDGKNRYLNERNLLVIDPVHPLHAVGDSDRYSINSHVFSQTSKHSQKPTSVRFPSIQPVQKKNALMTSDMLSYTSRLSKQSNIVSRKSGASTIKSQAQSLREQAEEYNATIQTQNSFAAAAPPIFLNPANLGEQKRMDNMSIQEDLLQKIILKRRAKEQEKIEKHIYEDSINEKVKSELNKMTEKEKSDIKNKKQTLKERLIEQKLERMNLNNMELKNSKKANAVHFPFGKNQRKELIIHRFEDKNMDEEIISPSNLQNIDLTKLKDAQITNDDRSRDTASSAKTSKMKESNATFLSEELNNMKALGKFTDRDNSKNLLDGHEKYQYDMLLKNLIENDVVNEADERVGVKLEKDRQAKILERLEFEKQIEIFNQKELLKAMKRKESQQANHQYWNQQINEAKARSQIERIISDGGGVQAAFLTKMFKFQESMEPESRKDYPSQKTEEDEEDDKSEVPKSNSRMRVDHGAVQENIKQQIEFNNNKKMEAKMRDIMVGQQMVNSAQASLLGESQFNAIKKMKAKQIMTKQWDEQQIIKNNEEVVHRIFT